METDGAISGALAGAHVQGTTRLRRLRIELRELMRLAVPIAIAQAGLAHFPSLVLAIPLSFAPRLIDAAGIDPDVIQGAKAFLWWRLPGLFPMLLFVAFRSYLQAAHKVAPLVVSTVIANVFNLLLDI